jgi:DNA-binding NarL/FixJ family response regulator
MTNVLVVEDESDARELLVRGLARAGYRAEGAVDGEQARPKLVPELDVLVTDLVMPRLDGISLLEVARDACPRALRVVLTSFADKERVVAALNLGASYLVEKPFTVQQIHELIQRLLRERAEASEPAAMLQARLAALELSEREGRLVVYVLKGLANKDIASLLGVTEQSVKNYLFQLYRKLGIASRGELFHLVFPV